MCNLGVKKMTALNVVEVPGSEMVNKYNILNSDGDDSMSKKIYECRLRLDDEMHNQIVSILDKFEKSGMSQIETIGFMLDVGMWQSLNVYKTNRQIWYCERSKAMGVCEEEEYRKDIIFVNFVRKFNDSPVVQELFGVNLDGVILEKMKNFTKLIGEVLNLENETILERVLDYGIDALYRSQNPQETFMNYEKILKFRKDY
jgi:hypothetical protein